MNTPQLSHTHQGIEIVYDEKYNDWKFTLRGRDRSAESLAKAKEFIDKPPPPPKEEKPFERIKVYYSDSYGNRKLVEAECTSVADSPAWRSYSEVWIQYNDENGKRVRTKADIRRVFPITVGNTKIVGEIRETVDQVDALNEKINKLSENLTTLKV